MRELALKSLLTLPMLEKLTQDGLWIHTCQQKHTKTIYYKYTETEQGRSVFIKSILLNGKRKKKETFTNRNFGLTNGNLKQLIQLLLSRFLFLFLFLSSHTKQTNKHFIFVVSNCFSNNISNIYSTISLPIMQETQNPFQQNIKYIQGKVALPWQQL